jgi:DNA (cytosine-5)-methyltransferase 1
MTATQPYETVFGCLDDLPPVGAGERHDDDAAHVTRNHRDSTIEKYDRAEVGDTPHGGQSPRVLPRYEPSWTVVVGDGKTPIHYDEPRMTTPREIARLQTIPDWFEFATQNRREMCRLVGNAVPPVLAESVFETLL